jgi:23S rRNA (uracil1939-C5)-methyltransferase
MPVSVTSRAVLANLASMRKIPADVGTEITVSIAALATGGTCVGTIEAPETLKGKKAFVTGAIPGESVKATITFSKKSFVNADATAIIKPSIDRVAPRCPVFSECGGCDLQHIQLQRQRQLKVQMVEDLLRVHGGVLAQDGVALLGADLPGFEYRRRMSFHINKKREFGLYRKHGRNIVELNHCPISTPTINAWLKDNLALVKECAPEIETVTVEDHDGEIFLAFEVHPKNSESLATLTPKSAFQELCAKYPNLQVNYRHKPIFRAKEVAVDAPPVGHFSQNNRSANDAMLRFLLDNVTTASVTDLYAGAGNISLPLAMAGKKVVAVEVDPHLVAFGEHRAREAKVTDRLTFHTKSCEKWVEKNTTEPTVVLDPPRGGALEVCQRLNAETSPLLLYVSCYPPTFARDVQILQERGYTLKQVHVLDMFPQTYHSELIGVLSRA